jgi:hypothetical protein
LLEGVVANDVRVQDEEGRVVLSENLLGELQRSSSAQGLGLDGEVDLDVVLLLVLREVSGLRNSAMLQNGLCTFWRAAVIISGR